MTWAPFHLVRNLQPHTNGALGSPLGSRATGYEKDHSGGAEFVQGLTGFSTTSNLSTTNEPQAKLAGARANSRRVLMPPNWQICSPLFPLEENPASMRN